MERTDKKNLAKAREYIKLGEAEEAKEILLTMPHSAVARRWLRQLERREKEEGKNHLYGIPQPVVRLILTSIAIWITTLIGFFIQYKVSSPIMVRFAGFLVGMVIILPVFQYIGWKAYWWMVAFVWILATLALLIFVFSGLAAQVLGVAL